MRLALCAETLAGMDFRAQCRFARAVGYEGIEIAPWRLGLPPAPVPPATIAEYRRIAAGEGIVISGFHYALTAPPAMGATGAPALSITSADPAVRARTLAVMRWLPALCAELGGGYVVHGSPEQRGLDPGDEEGCRRRGAEAYAEAGRVAATHGVTYLVEPVRRERTPFINTVAEAAAIAEAGATPGLGTMLDCCSGALSEAEKLEALLDRWLPTGLLAHVHANDANRRGPGEGSLRFAPILASLRRHGYAGWIAVEPFVCDPDGPACAARAAGYLRGLMEAA